MLGASTSRFAPSLVQLLLLVVVAREGSLSDVGQLVLGSATAFCCGSLAEVGFMTSLSVPQPYYGVSAPPLRATRRLRVAASAAGSVLYVILWAAGLGGHEPSLLLLAPLPFLLALSYGYQGALNASRRLDVEGAVSVIESTLVVVLVFALLEALQPVSATFVGLCAGRGLGCAARALLAQRFPTSEVKTLPAAPPVQLAFLATTILIVLQTQADILVLGFTASFALLGVVGPLMRTVYTPLLAAEAFSWAMFPLPSDDDRGRTPWTSTRSRRGGVALGVLLGLAVVALGEPFLELLLDRDLSLFPALAVLALAVPVRTVAFVETVDIVRAGRQAARLPVLALGIVLLLAGGLVGGITGSLTVIAAFRLASEAAVALGYFAIAHGARTGLRAPVESTV